MGEVIDLKVLPGGGKATGDILADATAANFRKVVVLGQSAEGSNPIPKPLPPIASLPMAVGLFFWAGYLQFAGARQIKLRRKRYGRWLIILGECLAFLSPFVLLLGWGAIVAYNAG